MATSTATTGTGGPAPPAESAAQPLWQAPVFVLGVVALVGVWLGRPWWGPGPGRLVGRDLAQARQLLARPDGDAEAALKLAQRALDAAEAFPERAGEAALLAGSAHIRLAERADPLPGARLA